MILFPDKLYVRYKRLNAFLKTCKLGRACNSSIHAVIFLFRSAKQTQDIFVGAVYLVVSIVMIVDSRRNRSIKHMINHTLGIVAQSGN